MNFPVFAIKKRQFLPVLVEGLREVVPKSVNTRKLVKYPEISKTGNKPWWEWGHGFQ